MRLVVLSLGFPTFCRESMKSEWWTSPPNLRSGCSREDCFYSNCGLGMAGGSREKLKEKKKVLWDLQGHWLLQMWNDNAQQFEGSGLNSGYAVLFVLSKRLVFHVGWGVGAVQATLTEGFPSWWVLRLAQHPESLLFLFMETVKHRPVSPRLRWFT